MSISAISQLILTRFWWNFKGRFLGTSTTDHNCHRDICPGNICLGDICPYQEYLNCYWPDFDETLKVGSCEHLEQIPTVRVIFVHATFVLATFVYIRNISAATDKVKARSWQCQSQFKTRSGQVHCKVKERIRQGKSKVKARSRGKFNNINNNYNKTNST